MIYSTKHDPDMQANKELGTKGKRALNDDSIIYCGMDVQRRVREAHLQVCLFTPCHLVPGCIPLALATSPCKMVRPTLFP